MRSIGERESVDSGMRVGFWVRGESSPSSMTPPLTLGSRQVRRVSYATDNKENVLPVWAVSARRRAKLRRSPLPHWYPRTPLRDITVIVNALERTRRARAAASQQRTRDVEATSESQDPVNEPHQLGSDDTSPSQILAADISKASGSSRACFPIPLLKDYQPNCTPGCTSVPEMPSPSTLPPKESKDLPSPEYEKKLESSIDKIEKVVMKHMKSPKGPVRRSTRSLMSMR